MSDDEYFNEIMEENERLRTENENLRLELDMQRAMFTVPSQKDDRLRIEHLNAALVAALDESAKLRAALKPFAVVANHIVTGTSDETICPDVEFTAGELRAAAAALKETGDE